MGLLKVYHLLIPNRSGDHVLAKTLTGGVLQLPRIELPATLEPPADIFMHRDGMVAALIGSRLGIDVHFVADCWASVENDCSDRGGVQEHYIRVMNLCDENPTLPESFKWIPRDRVAKCEWMRICAGGEEANIKMEVTDVFEEMSDSIPWEIYRVFSWFHVGWYYMATSWINDVLSANHMVPQGPVRERWRQPQSLVMTCKVRSLFEKGSRWEKRGSDELIYVKTVCPTLREGQRTAAIARVLGDIVPEVIAVHEKGGIMIQRDAGEIMDETFDQEALINTVAQMQKMSIGRVNELEAGGLRVMDSEWLACNVHSILHHEAFDDKRCVYDSDDNEDESFREGLKLLRSRVGVLQESFQKIASFRFPNTIVHGDLGLHNVGSRKNHGGKLYCFFDWAKVFVGHPLYDFADLLINSTILPDLPEFPQCAINYETALPLVCKLWMPSATPDEIKSVFKVTRVMRNAIEIYHVIQQYDALKPQERCHATEDLKQAAMDMLRYSNYLR